MKKCTDEYCKNCGRYVEPSLLCCSYCHTYCMDRIPQHTGLRGVWINIKRRTVLCYLKICEWLGIKSIWESK